MLRCRYCSSLFNKPRTGLANCPSCGGPDPEIIPEPQVTTAGYTYVPTTSNKPEFYRKDSQSFIERGYSNLGYKAMLGLIISTIATVLGLFVFFWFFYRTGIPKDTDPAYQNIIASPVPTLTAYAPASTPLDNLMWLTQQEALDLRNQENVVNLAFLKRGSAKYATVSLVFDSTWETTKPQGITELGVSGTFVVTKINGDKYNLNIYQPFVISGQDQVAFIVDQNGQVWKKVLTIESFTTLDIVKSSLPLTLEVNPNLNPTY